MAPVIGKIGHMGYEVFAGGANMGGLRRGLRWLKAEDESLIMPSKHGRPRCRCGSNGPD